MLLNGTILSNLVNAITGRVVPTGVLMQGMGASGYSGFWYLYAGAQQSLAASIASNVMSYTVSPGTSVLSAPAGGVAQLTGPIALTYAATGTIAFMRLQGATSGQEADVSVGLAGSGAECIVTSLTAALGVDVTNFSWKFSKTYGTATFNDSVVNSMLSCLTAAGGFNAGPNFGASGGYIGIYSGTAPANADATNTGTLLISFPLSTTSYAIASGGGADLAVALSATAVASGTASYARIVNSTGAMVIQGSVGTSGTDFVVSSTSISSGTGYTLNNAPISIAF